MHPQQIRNLKTGEYGSQHLNARHAYSKNVKTGIRNPHAKFGNRTTPVLHHSSPPKGHTLSAENFCADQNQNENEQ